MSGKEGVRNQNIQDNINLQTYVLEKGTLLESFKVLERYKQETYCQRNYPKHCVYNS